MLPVSAISDAATRLRALLINNIDDLSDLKQVKIGHPKETLATMVSDLNSVNLFFYRVGYDGFPADGGVESPFYVRLFCLVTAVGATPTDSGPSTGENDLRLIGEIMRVLHETPVVMVENKDGDSIAELQVVPHSLDLDGLNHIWSTQGDVAYRLSVAYEMSLAPIPLAQPVEMAPRVGEIGVTALSHTHRPALPDGGFGVSTTSPQVLRKALSTGEPDWKPHICFADTKDKTLSFHRAVAKSALPAGSALVLTVALAGKAGQGVKLVWETWNSSDGWVRSAGAQNETLAGNLIDPDSFFEPVKPGMLVDVALPIDDKGQALLYAEREWAAGDGNTRSIRSNPILVTVTEGSP